MPAMVFRFCQELLSSGVCLPRELTSAFQREKADKPISQRGDMNNLSIQWRSKTSHREREPGACSEASGHSAGLCSSVSSVIPRQSELGKAMYHKSFSGACPQVKCTYPSISLSFPTFPGKKEVCPPTNPGLSMCFGIKHKANKTGPAHPGS